MTSSVSPVITTATRADLTDVVALLSAQFEEHRIDAGDIGRGAAGLIDEPSRGAIFLASLPEDPRRRIGLAVLAFTWTLEHGGQVAWLDELYVVPALRGASVGTTLLEHALAAARTAGCAAVDLEVDADHRRVEGLYQRKGFTRLDRNRWALRL